MVNGLFSGNQQTIINWLDSDEDIFTITSKLVTFMAYTLYNSRSFQKWPLLENRVNPDQLASDTHCFLFNQEECATNLAGNFE